MFLEFALEAGAIAEAQSAELWDEGWEALGEAAAAQAEHQAGEEPTRQFVELLTSAIVAGDAHVADAKAGDGARGRRTLGLALRDRRDGRVRDEEWQPQGKCVGWLNEDGSLLLEPGAAYAAAQRMARDQGTGLTVKQRTLWKRMAEKGLLGFPGLQGWTQHHQRHHSRGAQDGDPPRRRHLVPGERPYRPRTHRETALRGRNAGPFLRRPRRKRPARTARTRQKTALRGRIGPFLEGGTGEKEEQNARHPLDTEPLLVESEAAVRVLLPELDRADRVALDLETTGLDPQLDRIRLLTVATERGVWLVDCFQVDPSPLFEVLAEKELVIHNGVFDLGFVAQLGFELGENGKVLDTMLASQLLQGCTPYRQGGRVTPQKKTPTVTPHSLQGVAKRELGIEIDKESRESDWGGEMSAGMVEYAAKDAQILLPLADVLMARVVDAELEKVFEIERRALLAVTWMQNAGLPLDAKGWTVYLGQVENEIDRLKERLAKIAPERPEGKEWNWNSSPQTKEALP